MLSGVEIASVFSGAAFLFYGVSCLVSTRMVLEFDRYRLARFRLLVGFLEVLGGIGLLASLFFAPLVAPASGGLFLLMAVGIFVRFRIRDPIPKVLPAFLFLVLNGFIFSQAFTRT